jgi:polar amino acid transport system substrate-binding protein
MPNSMPIDNSSLRPRRFGAALAALFAFCAATPVFAATPALPERIATAKTITYCSAITLPPMEFFNAQQQPQGVDIELGDQLAARLGVKAKWLNMPFAGLIPALLADHCDAIISQLFIKAPRLEVIDEIPYMNSQEAVLLKAGSPTIATLADLSGKKAATVTGTTATQLLQAASEDLKKAGKAPIDIVMFPENTPALQQLQFGQVYAYGVAYETALYYSKIAPGQFELGGPSYFKILTGIGVSKNQKPLEEALKTALAGMMKDGSYAAIFKKWGLEDDMLPE